MSSINTTHTSLSISGRGVRDPRAPRFPVSVVSQAAPREQYDNAPGLAPLKFDKSLARASGEIFEKCFKWASPLAPSRERKSETVKTRDIVSWDGLCP